MKSWFLADEENAPEIRLLLCDTLKNDFGKITVFMDKIILQCVRVFT